MGDESERILNKTNFLYWLLLALVITVEQMTFGRWWKRREAHRWTMGYITVFGLGLWPLLRRRWDFPTFAALFMAVGISGAIKVGLEGLIAAWRAAELREVRPYGQNRGVG